MVLLIPVCSAALSLAGAVGRGILVSNGVVKDAEVEAEASLVLPTRWGFYLFLACLEPVTTAPSCPHFPLYRHNLTHLN